MSHQLPLRLQLRAHVSFASYHHGPNAQAVAALQRCVHGQGERVLYLWGPSGVGRTHLLEAACAEATAQGEASSYLPMAQLAALGPAILVGLEALPLVCVDDLQSVAGQATWEEALFHLYNRILESGAGLVLAADATPHGLGLLLPDLVSRLGSALILQLHPLDDAAKVEALSVAARERGMVLGDGVARFLLRRHSRDMHSLIAALDRLDQASLAAQHRLTIPFVKTALELPDEST